MKNFAILALLGLGGYFLYKKFSIVDSAAKTAADIGAQARMAMTPPPKKLLLNVGQRFIDAQSTASNLITSQTAKSDTELESLFTDTISRTTGVGETVYI